MRISNRIRRSFSTRLSFFVLLFTSVIFLITFFLFYFFTSRTIREDARIRAEDLLENINLKIEQVFSTVQTVPDNILWAVISKGIVSDSLYSLTYRILQENDFIFGSAVAFEPNYFPDKGYYFSPYSYRDGDTIRTIQLGTDTYDYLTMEWYKTPKDQNSPHWSEPYYDEGGGEMLMCTYSNPIHDSKGNFIGILTVDVSLDWLTDVLNMVKPYPSSYAILLGRTGTYIVHPQKEMIMEESIFSFAESRSDSAIIALGQCMIRGEKGITEISNTSHGSGMDAFVVYKPLTFNDWSLGMVINKDEVFQGLNRMNRTIISLIFLGLVALFVFCMITVRHLTRPLVVFARSAREVAGGNFNAELPEIPSDDEMGELHRSFVYMQQQLTEYMEELKSTSISKERIESELRIARDIQMGMIPKSFPPFPERDDIDLYAVLRPAKEVGGDLYDFFIESGRLFFMIGDVSGKGVPASLFMAVTRSLFRSVAAFYSNTACILQSMNSSLVETNDSGLFVTLFVGILELETGVVSYCNAGHNRPVVITPGGEVRFLELTGNIPAGIFPDFEYDDDSFVLERGSSLVLYTDGLTEAEDPRKNLYSDNHLLEVLRGLRGGTPKEITEELVISVDEHAAGANQSDDLTIFTISY